MIHYLVLLTLTVAISYLGLLIWRKTREPGFLLILAMMYYWSLMGAWFMIYDDLTGGKGVEFGLSYYVYTEILFPVHADGCAVPVAADRPKRVVDGSPGESARGRTVF